MKTDGFIPHGRYLKSRFPQIAAEWDYSQNDRNPDEITAFSHYNARWICRKGHSYPAIIKNRTALGHGCPYCSGKKPIKGETDLQTRFPKIAAEWDYDNNTKTPDQYTAFSNHKVKWICQKRHSYPATICARTAQNTGCPYCSGKKPIKGETDLETRFPKIAAEWDYENNTKTPDQYTAFSGDTVKWICERGHSYLAVIYNRTAHNSGCPYCSGRKPIKGETDLETRFPKIAAEWDYENNTKTPDQYTAFSGDTVKWICPKGHPYPAKIYARTAQNSGCPFCCGKEPIKDKTDLVTLFSEIAAEWDYENNTKTPDQYTAFSNDKVKWICQKGHSYPATICARTAHNSGCPYCSGRKPIKGETDLVTRFPEIAAEWDYENNTKTPDQYTAFSNDKVKWICQKGHSYPATICARTAHNSGCPYCSGRKPIKGETDLATLFPEIVAEWDYENNAKTPDQYTAFSGDKVKWICPNGHPSYPAVICNRTAQNTGCPVCNGRKTKHIIRNPRWNLRSR